MNGVSERIQSGNKRENGKYAIPYKAYDQKLRELGRGKRCLIWDETKREDREHDTRRFSQGWRPHSVG